MELQDIIATKLNVHPRHLHIQYRLNFTNKSGTDATDITDEEELMIFKAKMRKLIVPQKTASGKLSTCVLPDVTVIFEPQGTTGDPPAGKSSGKAKKVSYTFTILSHALLLKNLWSKQSGNDHDKATLAITDEEHKAIVSELQTLYRCHIHSKKEGVETFCYPEPTNDRVHHAMTYSDLGFWAAQVVSNIFPLSSIQILMQVLETKSAKRR
jgi:hypothetical protein